MSKPRQSVIARRKAMWLRHMVEIRFLLSTYEGHLCALKRAARNAPDENADFGADVTFAEDYAAFDEAFNEYQNDPTLQRNTIV